MISLHEGQGRGAAKPTDRALLLRLQVAGCSPEIWRRLVVKESMWLSRLHDSIQVSLDWFDYQTHQFVVGERRYGNPIKRDELEILDDRDVKLEDLDLVEGQHFGYAYHFGDGWHVDILVEKIIPVQRGRQHPRCIEGERAGPPEDCGGLEAFHDMLACILEPETQLGREWLDWLGPDYRADRCDTEAINKALKRLK